MYSNNFPFYEENPFRSFLMGGFECADHQNAFGNRVDLYEASGHQRYLAEDYDRLKNLSIATVREGIRWSKVETKPYQYDWSETERIIRISQSKNIQVVWDICHFGYPDDLTPLHPMFARRFSHLCREFVIRYRSIVPDGELIVTPINEVSFISWLGGDVKGTSPYCTNLGWEVKYSLMKAYIEGIELMKAVDPSIRIMVTEPLISIVSEQQRDTLSVLLAQEKHFEQFQVHDILSGKICPELRGKPEYLDIIGVNYYYNNQWIFETHEFIPWNEKPSHPFFRSLQSLIQTVYLRYGRQIVISETSHPGEDRAKWINSIKDECVRILQSGIPLVGCCYYPLVDRTDWDDLSHWHHSGIWDVHNPISLKRETCVESMTALKNFHFEVHRSEAFT